MHAAGWVVIDNGQTTVKLEGNEYAISGIGFVVATQFNGIELILYVNFTIAKVYLDALRQFFNQAAKVCHLGLVCSYAFAFGIVGGSALVIVNGIVLFSLHARSGQANRLIVWRISIDRGKVATEVNTYGYVGHVGREAECGVRSSDAYFVVL